MSELIPSPAKGGTRDNEAATVLHHIKPYRKNRKKSDAGRRGEARQSPKGGTGGLMRWRWLDDLTLEDKNYLLFKRCAWYHF